MSTASASATAVVARRLQEEAFWRTTGRNGGIGFLIGGVVLVLQFNKARKNKKRWKRFKQEWIIYLMKYPLFLASFTALYTGLNQLGRRLIGNRGLTVLITKAATATVTAATTANININAKHITKVDAAAKTAKAIIFERHFLRKLSIAMCGFFCGYLSQLLSPVFSWNWAMYACLRSILGMLRLLIPTDLQPRSVNVYALVHGLLPMFICFNVVSLPKSYLGFFRSCLDESRARYMQMFNHSHCILPPCAHVIHLKHESCWKTLILDMLHRYRVCFLWYAKFYVLTSLLGGVAFLKKMATAPKLILFGLLMQTIRSSAFLTVSFQIPSRMLCLVTWVLQKYHGVYKQNEFAAIAAYLPSVVLVTSAIFGSSLLRLELSESKHTDIALFSIWKMMEQLIRHQCDLSTFDSDAHHPILSNEQIPAILFGIACALAVYVQITDSTALKSFERGILKFFQLNR